VGAAYRDMESGGRVQGASTLTMQLARNLFLSPDRSFHRKVQEAMLAIQIERRFTKPQIFTLYANQIFLGHGVYGFEAASEFYFNKPARRLTLEEAALLAGLPKGPGVYSPINHPDRALKRPGRRCARASSAPASAKRSQLAGAVFRGGDSALSRNQIRCRPGA